MKTDFGECQQSLPGRSAARTCSRPIRAPCPSGDNVSARRETDNRKGLVQRGEGGYIPDHRIDAVDNGWGRSIIVAGVPGE
ncbi:MAG: hypothetical protein F4X92_08640 [Gammaproteobacteria bacterium]|nr:hypothetical protein [Gammaproteobacteria bacterium]